MENIIRVYDRNMKKLAYLENAYDIGYELPLNELWYANFTLPADDFKNQHCQPFNYVEIYDGRERIELFRIMPSKLTRNTKGDTVYQCEHVLATLLDDVLFKYHQIGNIGVGTAYVIRYILDKQIDKRWQLGVCEFDRRFEYKWENENLLAALFSVPQPFNEGYRWEFDTTGELWRIHLRKLPTKFKADITYKKNMTEIQKESDPTTVVTRLYCLGYGEGDNQLGIESVNNGIPYIESNGATTTWGIKSSILADRRFESPETLKAYGQSLLNQLKHPYKSYTTKAVDLYRKSPEKYEKFFPGDIIRIIDKEDGITEDLPIIKVSKNDITGNPGDVEIEIGNQSRNIAGSISELQDRTRINEVYAQGATNQLIVPFADNADFNNPAVINIFVPEEMIRINKCLLNLELEAFRAYSKAISSAPIDTTGQSSTTSSGASSKTSSGASSKTSSGPSSERSSGPSSRRSSGPSSRRTTTTEDVRVDVNWTIYGSGDPSFNLLSTRELRGTEYEHSHGVEDHRHRADVKGHDHDMDHYHDIDHDHDIRHTHDIDHTHDINHTHEIKHTHTIPSHGHDLEFGIFRGGVADNFRLRIDGKLIPGQFNTGEDINLVPYFSVDGGGKIRRNTWHKIEIIPNKLTRVIANVFMQTFNNSRGGGDY